MTGPGGPAIDVLRTQPARRFTRHELDPISLVAGLVFAGAGLSFLLGGDAFLDLDWRWVWPPVLIGAGVIGLLGGRRHTEDRIGPPSSG